MAPAPSAERAVERRWYETAFDRGWLRAYAHRGDAEASRHAPAVARWLGVHAGQRVLDVGCGAGRYARALAVLGLRVTGIDLSRPMIEEALERSPMLPGSPTYVLGDARRMLFHEQFEGAVSMFTSLGYFEDAEDDARILRGVRRALVPGGRLLVDFLNAAHLRATFVESKERLSAGLRVLEVRRIDESSPGGPVVEKRVTIFHPRTGHEEAAWTERVRLYDADEIDALLAAAGLRTVGHRMGDLDGTPHSWTTARLVRIAERPRR
jgi:SAM-dependent methyltransferase